MTEAMGGESISTQSWPRRSSANSSPSCFLASSAGGFGGSVPAVSTERFAVVVALTSAASGSLRRKTSVKPGSRATPRRWWSCARRRSQSTTIVFSPAAASSRARFTIVVVLPSWGAVPVTSTTWPRSSLRAKRSAVRRFW